MLSLDEVMEHGEQVIHTHSAFMCRRCFTGATDWEGSESRFTTDSLPKLSRYSAVFFY